MEKGVTFCFGTAKTARYRGSDLFKTKILYIIEKYYRNKPIYVCFFRRYGTYQKIRKVLEELVREGYLIKHRNTRPVYYLRSEMRNFIISADKL